MSLSLTDSHLLTPAEMDAALYHSRQGGGSTLRVLELALEEQEVNTLWRRIAAELGRPFYEKGHEIETLEEAIEGERGLEPILSREMALTNLTPVQRQEGTALHLLTVDPYFQEEPIELRLRAKTVNVL